MSELWGHFIWDTFTSSQSPGQELQLQTYCLSLQNNIIQTQKRSAQGGALLCLNNGKRNDALFKTYLTCGLDKPFK